MQSLTELEFAGRTMVEDLELGRRLPFVLVKKLRRDAALETGDKPMADRDFTSKIPCAPSGRSQSLLRM